MCVKTCLIAKKNQRCKLGLILKKYIKNISREHFWT